MQPFSLSDGPMGACVARIVATVTHHVAGCEYPGSGYVIFTFVCFSSHQSHESRLWGEIVVNSAYLLALSGCVFSLLVTTQTPLSVAAEIGTVAAVNRDMNGTPPQSQPRPLDLGTRIVQDERIETSEVGSGQLLFMDQTSLTVAPNSDIVLDSYAYDPEGQTGDMTLSLTRGALRFVGGRISKKSEVQVRTPTATIGIRGGLVIIEVDDAGQTTAIQIAGEYTHVTGIQGGRVTLSRPNSSASSDQAGSVEFRGLLESNELREIQQKFEGSGDGDSTASLDQNRVETKSTSVSQVNSDVQDGPLRTPVSTSGEKPISGTGDDTGPVPLKPTDGGGTSDPIITTTLPTDGGFFSPSTGFVGFSSITSGSLIGTTPGGDTVHIPVAQDTTDFVTSIAGSPVPSYFAQTLSPNSGFFEFAATSGMTSALGPISGFGFSDLDEDFHLYQFDTAPAAGPVEHGIILFGNPSAGQAAVFEGDDGTNIASSANTVGLYVIEPDLNPLGGGGTPPSGVLMIANGGEARFGHSSATLPAGSGGRVLVGETRFETLPGGLQQSDFSVMAAPIRGGASTGPRIGTSIFATSVVGNTRNIQFSNVGTFEDVNGNTVFGANDRYIVVSSLHRPGGVGPMTFDPGTQHDLGQPDQPLEPFLNLLTRDASNDFIANDPLPLANDPTSRTGVGFGVAGSFDAVFANGFAMCSTGNCGSRLSSAGPSGVYALSSQTAFSGDGGHFTFQSATSPSGPDTNTFAARFKVFDALDLGNIQRGGGSPSEVPYEFEVTSAVNDVSAYVDDGHFGLSASFNQTVDGQAVDSNFMLSSEGLSSDGGIIPATAGPSPEFLRWGWWAATAVVTENGGGAREDMVHLGTWVAGNRPNLSDLPTTGIASFQGLAVGTDADLATGTTAVVGGDFSMSYDFGQGLGTFNLNIAGHAFSNIPVAANLDDPQFAAYGGLDSGSGTFVAVDGAFFSGGGDPVAATGGQFQIDDFVADRQVIGIFAGDRTTGAGP